MVVLSPDIYDSIHTTDHPVELPPLDGTSVTHHEDVSVLLDMTDTLLTIGIPGLPSPCVAVGRPGGTLPTFAFGSDSPDFLDTGDPALCLPVPKLRCCFRIMDFASDIDPGPDLSGREFGRTLGRQSGPFVPAVRPLLVEVGCYGFYVGECLLNLILCTYCEPFQRFEPHNNVFIECFTTTFLHTHSWLNWVNEDD